jgi:spoIIIJ-associated protein
MSTTQQRVTSEGQTLGEAIRKAAEQLSVTPDRIGHEIDRAHFLSPTGRSQGAQTVKIFAWSRAPVDSSGADAASGWLSGLIEKMGFEGKIKIKMTGDKRADLAVSSPNGRHLVGRRGATLHAIQELLEASVPAAQDGWTFRIDNRRRTPEDVDALRRLATKLGKRVLDNGGSIIVRQELNSFERRIIHVTIGDMRGIDTESVIQDGVKRVKIMLVSGEE